jgi:hypothetical protein
LVQEFRLRQRQSRFEVSNIRSRVYIGWIVEN